MVYEWIGIGITAVGVIGALIYNGIQIRNTGKSNHYLVFKDLINEFTNIERTTSMEIIENSYSTREELEEQKVELEMMEEVEKYRWEYLQFHDKIARLRLTDIIPKEIVDYYSDTFPTALLYLELDYPNDKLHYDHLRKWCKQENIIMERLPTGSQNGELEITVEDGITYYPDGKIVDSHGSY